MESQGLHKLNQDRRRQTSKRRIGTYMACLRNEAKNLVQRQLYPTCPGKNTLWFWFFKSLAWRWKSPGNFDLIHTQPGATRILQNGRRAMATWHGKYIHQTFNACHQTPVTRQGAGKMWDQVNAICHGIKRNKSHAIDWSYCQIRSSLHQGPHKHIHKKPDTQTHTMGFLWVEKYFVYLHSVHYCIYIRDFTCKDIHCMHARINKINK